MTSIIKCETARAMSIITVCPHCGGPVTYTVRPGRYRIFRMESDGKAAHAYICELRPSRKDTFLSPNGTVDLGSLSTVYGDNIAQQVAKTLHADGKPGALPFPYTRAQIIAALPCSHCGVPAGSPCKHGDGRQRKRVHDARIHAARDEAIAWLYGM